MSLLMEEGLGSSLGHKPLFLQEQSVTTVFELGLRLEQPINGVATLLQVTKRVGDIRVVVLASLLVLALILAGGFISGKQDAILGTALHEASTSNNVVIVSVFTVAWKEMLAFWLERLESVGRVPIHFRKHVLLLALDLDGFRHCQTLQPKVHCYLDTQRGAAVPMQYGQEEIVYDSEMYIAMTWRRVELLHRILKLGYHVVLSDLDNMWLKVPPFPFQAPQAALVDAVMSTGFWSLDPERMVANSGFFFLRSNAATSAWVAHWLAGRKTRYEGMPDGFGLNQVRPDVDTHSASLGMRVQYLKTTVAGTFCEERDTWLELVSMHANCMKRLHTKKAALEEFLAKHDAAAKELLSTLNDPRPSLLEAAAAASLPDKTVVVTSFTADRKELLELFLERLRLGQGTQGYMAQLLTLTFDHPSYMYCRRLKLQCFLDTEFPERGIRIQNLPPINGTTPFGADVSLFGNPYAKKYKSMMWRRLALLKLILDGGYHVLLTNTDVLWLKDPYPTLTSGNEDMKVQLDTWDDNPANVSAGGGFWFLRSNERSKEFIRIWLSDHRSFPELSEQESLGALQPVGGARAVTIHSFTLRVLPPTLFGTFCSEPPVVQNLLTIHAGCMFGSDKKRDMLIKFIAAFDSVRPPNRTALVAALPDVSPTLTTVEKIAGLQDDGGGTGHSPAVEAISRRGKGKKKPQTADQETLLNQARPLESDSSENAIAREEEALEARDELAGREAHGNALAVAPASSDAKLVAIPPVSPDGGLTDVRKRKDFRGLSEV